MKTKVAEIGALEEGKGVPVKAEAVSLVLVKMNGQVHALENKCPHFGLPFGRGKIENGEIVCPFHGSRFKVDTGENTDWVCGVAGIKMPDWTRKLIALGMKPQGVKTFPVTVEGDAVFVDL